MTLKSGHHTFILKNDVFVKQFPFGLRFAHHTTKFHKGASVILSISAGAYFENTENQGVAHFLEHMIFKSKVLSGNHKGQRYSKIIEILGGDLNATTNKESISFELNCHKSCLIEIFPYFLGMVLDFHIELDEFFKEKNVILQELREDAEDFDVLACELTHLKSFNFKLGHSVGGTLSSVKNMTPKLLESFYRKFFTPERMILTIGSSLTQSNVDKISVFIKNKFKGSKNKSPFCYKLCKKFGAPKSFSSTVKKKTNLATVSLNFAGPSIASRYGDALRVIDDFLSDGLNSRLFLLLREEQGLVYSFDTEINDYINNGSYCISLSCYPSNVKRSIDKIKNALKELNHTGIEKAKLQEIKTRRVQFLEYVMDDLDQRNQLLSNTLLFKNKVPSLELMSESIMNVSERDISVTLDLLLRPKPGQLVILPK